MNSLLVAIVLSSAACSAQVTKRVARVGDTSLPTAFAKGQGEDQAIRAADDTWLAALEEPVLLRLVAEAQRNSSDIHRVEARLDRSRAFAGVARAALSPTIDLEMTASSTGRFSPETNSDGLVTVALSASWEADVFGRLRKRASATEHEVATSVADRQAARRLLTGAVAEAYFLAQEAKMQVDVSRRNNELLAETLGYVETQFERGLRSGQDLALIQADAATSQSALTTAENAFRAALRALEVLIGRFPSADVDLTASLARLPDSLNAPVPAALLELRPDIVAAANRIRAAERSRAAAAADRSPRIGLTGSIGAESTSVKGVVEPAAVIWRVGASATLPLLDGGRRRALVDDSAAVVDEAVSAYNSTALAAFREVGDGIDRARVLGVREAALQAALTSASKALKFARFRYESGESDLLDVLSIQQRVSSIESQMVATQRARLVQYVTLALALGRFPEPQPRR